MPKSKKHIEEGVRNRFLDAIDEVKSMGTKKGTSYKEIFDNIESFQQVHSQMKDGSRYPTIKELVLFNQKYKYSLQWLMLGIGNKKIISKAITKANAISLIEEGLSMLKANKKAV